jgi:hypothetical protein
LAVARYYDDNPARRAALSNQALALAHAGADNLALAHVLRLRMLALSGPDYPEQCLDASTELLSLPDLPQPLAASARLLLARVLMTLGRIPDAATEFNLLVPLVEQLRSSPLQMQLDWSRAGLLLLTGRWAEAEVLSRATFEIQARMRWSIARAARMVQRWELAYFTGTGADLIDELRTAAQGSGMPGLRSTLAMALVQAGRVEEARLVLRCLAPGPRNYMWLYTQCWALLAASRLNETTLVVKLRAELLPYRQLACMVGWAVVSGSVAYFTGEGALALNDPNAALADFTIAIKADKQMGALPWLAQAHDAITRAQQFKNRNL